ncbi:kinase-like domain-containing protein [Annulohypoxylon maeteangense]|uniref:kinase-like domain-containing protein n=1 Tax=Annulohypoxylon maeteangense TaxID=1927788 RepID=UPI0020074135|nr:kinase-like domain-containing protein [Annulohypoxylon maeteangense]KAI0887118.1 kinase-like domain-containing protein [Annulohypoxylon maeteangense]
MSTPTTATATLPPHYRHHHHPSHHYPPYPNLSTSGSSYRAVAITGVASNPIIPTSTSTASTATVSNHHQAHSSSSYTTSQIYSASSQTLRPSPNGVAASIATTRPTQDSTRTNSTPHIDAYKASMPPSTASTTQTYSDGQPRKRRRSKEPDWKTFYKNGLPKEIIVIDDTPEPDKDSAVTSTRTHANDETTRHGPKRRRKEDVVRNDDAYSSRVNGSYQQTSNSSSTSTDRTTSAHNTTAATSLGSLSSNGQYDYESRQVGQKRKRTRQQIAQEAKRREIEVLGDAFVTYRPPQKPVKKAGDVTVRSVNDRSDQRHQRVDDDDGHYIVVPDADLTPQYQMIKLLGQGTFGKVVQARDRKRNKLVAIKIIRAVQKYRDASRIELRVLQTLKANDDENRNRCIHLRDCFDFRGHICIVMDLLGSSVFDFLKSNNFVPFPNSQIQSFARQLFTSVAFLHDLNLIHTDLKPENILLCDSAYQTFTYNRRIPSSSAGVNRQATQRKVLLDTEIRLIDFGSATFQDEYHSSVVSTRHYRAPEIILGLGWSFPCDIWSIGCILVEFFTGDALFQTHDNLEHLAMMENVCDCRIDNHLVQTVNKMATRSTGNAASKYGSRAHHAHASTNPTHRYFKRLKLDYPTAETTRASRRFVKNMKRLSDIIPASSPFLRSFLDLLQRIFVYDPAKRITARQALEHEWFREPAIPDDGTEAAKIRLERMREHEFPATRGVAVA